MNTDNFPALFDKAFHHLMKVEGAYVNDPDDPGGETMYGISKRQYPHLNIKALTINTAKQIYFHDYWLHYRCDEMPPIIACFYFDALVNHKPKTAAKFLQTAYRVWVDGQVGRETMGAIQRLTSDETQLERLRDALACRADYYHDLVEENPVNGKFLVGWFRRLFSLQQFILSEVVHGAD